MSQFDARTAADWPDRPLLVRYAPYVDNLSGRHDSSSSMNTNANSSSSSNSNSNSCISCSSCISSSKNITIRDSTDGCKNRVLKLHLDPPELSSISINNDFFVGKCHIMVKDAPGSPLNTSNLKRKLEYILQGQFKKRIPFSKVFTGHAYDTPLNYEPPEWLISILRSLILTIQPDVSMCPAGPHPCMLSTMISSMQHVNISHPGSEPNIFKDLVGSRTENMSLLGHEFDSMSSSARKRYFTDKSNIDRYNFEPCFVYTFDFYQHLIDILTFKLDLGRILGQYDIFTILGSKPLQIMALILDDPISITKLPSSVKDKNDTEDLRYKKANSNSTYWNFIFNIELWHERAPPPSDPNRSF